MARAMPTRKVPPPTPVQAKRPSPPTPANADMYTNVSNRGVPAQAAQTDEQADEQSSRAVERMRRTGAETGDRVVVSGTRAMVLMASGQRREAEKARRHMDRAIRKAASRVRAAGPTGLERALLRLGEAALDPRGPLYPRPPLVVPDPA